MTPDSPANPEFPVEPASSDDAGPATRPHCETSPLPDFRRNEGLLPAIAQDAETGQVLMLAYMNAESYAETLRTGRAVYWSRSRGRLWRKGEESGHVQHVHQILVDCDADTILLQVTQQGAACHEGYRSCFFREVSDAGARVVAQRLVDPDQVYASHSSDPASTGADQDTASTGNTSTGNTSTGNTNSDDTSGNNTRGGNAGDDGGRGAGGPDERGGHSSRLK